MNDDETFVTIAINILGGGYTLSRSMNLVGAPGETPTLSSVSIDVESDDGARFTLHFDDDRAVATFALRLLAEVERFLEGTGR